MCMANSIPERKARWLSARLTFPALTAFACSLGWAQQSGMPLLQPDMPITLDADSSEFDYQSGRLVFRGLRLDQGNLGVSADLAETENLDFTDGLWIFRGNVSVDAESAQLYCEEARLTFRNHQLTEAILIGYPARFKQQVGSNGKNNTGEANRIVYGLSSGLLEMSDKAKFSDGANEISGEIITYDLNAGKLTAGAGSSGPVRIYIEPPATDPVRSP